VRCDLKIHPRDRADRRPRALDLDRGHRAAGRLTGGADRVGVHFSQTAWQFFSAPDDRLGGGGGQGHTFISSPRLRRGDRLPVAAGSAAAGGAGFIVKPAGTPSDPQRSTARRAPGAGLQRAAAGARSPAQCDSAAVIARIDRTVDSMVAAGGNRAALDSSGNS
jgi:hypothetical protein